MRIATQLIIGKCHRNSLKSAIEVHRRVPSKFTGECHRSSQKGAIEVHRRVPSKFAEECHRSSRKSAIEVRRRVPSKLTKEKRAMELERSYAVRMACNILTYVVAAAMFDWLHAGSMSSWRSRRVSWIPAQLYRQRKLWHLYKSNTTYYYASCSTSVNNMEEMTN